MARQSDVHRFETRAMGSPLRATLVGLDGRAASTAWQAIVAEVAATEAVLSRFLPGSDLSRLNRSAGTDEWVAVPRRLGHMLHAARRAWRVTGGQFDPRVLADLEALGERAGVDLPRGEPAKASGPWLELRPRPGLARTARPLDSGGIGKGLALRWAKRAVEECLDPGRFGLLIEAGGDIVVRGPAPDGSGWRIGIEDPFSASADEGPLAVIELEAGAVATSSIAVRHWRGPHGHEMHHLIDPASGRPGGGGLRAVSVAMPDPAWAEVWTKALFLVGPRAIGPKARARGLAAWWVAGEGTLEMTPAARERTIWQRARTSARSA